MNYQEIYGVLSTKMEGDISTFAYGDFDQEELGLGEIKEVVQKGGEGEGSEWYVVYYFSDHDVYMKIEGYYSSYNGTDFDGGWEDCASEVKPQTKTITVYE